MKKKLVYKSLFIISMMLFWLMSDESVAYGDEEISASEFGDVNFYNYAIENFDTNGNGQLERSEAQAVTVIELLSRRSMGEYGNIDDLTSLDGVEHFENLTTFSVQGNTSKPIKDISPLRNFTNMNALCIRQQYNIENYSIISELVNLEILDLCNTSFSDASILKDLKQLKMLEIADGQLVNVEVLGTLTNLEFLRLQNCSLKEIAFIDNLHNLKLLDLQHNNITDFTSILGSKESITHLSIGNYNGGEGYKLEVEQLQFLTQMKNLQSLGIIDCNMEDIPDLSGLTNLTSISLHSNSLHLDDIINKLPASITSVENWIIDSGLDRQEGVENPTMSIIVPTTEPEVESQTKQETVSSEETSIRNDHNDETTSGIIEGNGENEEYYDIEIQGEFGCKVYISAEEKRNLKEYENIIDELVGRYNNAVDVKVYDISVHNAETDKKMQPNGQAKISIIFDAKEGCEYIVFELAENGDYKEIKSYLSDGKLHFYTENINAYMVLSMDESGVYEEKENDSEGILPIIVIGIGAMVVLVGGMLIFIVERRKR